MTGADRALRPDAGPRRWQAMSIPTTDLPVIELGPGTGVVTEALIERGVAPSGSIAIEYNPDFCRLLRERFPGVTVIEGDAYDLAATLPTAAPTASRQSSRACRSSPGRRRPRAADRGGARPDGARPPLYPVLLYAACRPLDRRRGRFSAEASHWIWLNLPPARVWLYRRARPAEAGAASAAR